jgi:bifunctional UDP-N-acetylglucosamine pyrophosphorylase/glucosamine-1-phosphate N-acetyltransferase
VLHLLAGRSVIDHVLGAVDPLAAATTALVIGHARQTSAPLRTGATQFVVQSPQLGTGHALQQTESLFLGKTGTLLLLHANVPLISTGTLTRLLERHRATRAAMTLLTSSVDDPYGHERVVRDAQGHVTRIVQDARRQAANARSTKSRAASTASISRRSSPR